VQALRFCVTKEITCVIAEDEMIGGARDMPRLHQGFDGVMYEAL
jgi:hypothetical protein